MQREKIDKFVRDVLVNEFECNPDTLTESTLLFEDLDLDSIDAVDLVVRMQKEYNVSMKPEDFQGIRTYGDLVDMLCKTIGDIEI